MLVKSWGSRGSIPVSGPEYVQYGGDTTCIEVRTKNDEIIIIDAGTGLRRLGKQLIAEKRFHYNLIFTHAHWDHLIGFPFFRPLYMRQTRIKVHGCPFAMDYVHTMLSRVMSPPNFPVSFTDIKAHIEMDPLCLERFVIDSVTVSPIRLSHPNQGSGYKFVEDGRTFVFLTDNELDYRHPGGLDAGAYRDFCSGAELLIHDAEFTEEEYRRFRTWGHSSYKSALDLALRAGVKELGLYHLNQDRTDAEMNEIVVDCRRIIADRGAKLECFGVTSDMSIRL
ncbi:MAG: MBL fold metallo-hydrolase [Syntrophobacterales bacterium]|nr:MBL fold metallo-hydrolase [Syntrophobacterales bacterium]